MNAETITNLMAVSMVIVSVVAIFALLDRWLSELWFWRTFRWGNARQIRRAVKLGWNTGIPPENVLLLVRNGVKEKTRLPLMSMACQGDWGVMVHRNGFLHVYGSWGNGMPVENAVGWLEVVDYEK